jgi:hypothetical protein
MTSIQLLETIGSVASLFVATLCQEIPGRNHKLENWNNLFSYKVSPSTALTDKFYE